MEEKAHIIIHKDGPIEVSGEFIVQSNGLVVESNRKSYLCRCGASNKKPYCDGSHKRVGFVG